MGIEILIVILVAVLIDLLLGELPSAIHPVVWMGKLTEQMKACFLCNSPKKNRYMGFFMTMLLICIFSLGFCIVLFVFSFNPLVYLLMAAILLSTTFSIKSLLRSASEVGQKLGEDLQKGREAVSFLVSRETSNLSSQEVVSATIETLTENITDSVIAPLFYSFVLALIGLFTAPYSQSLLDGRILSSSYQLPITLALTAGLTYRVVNTLDAMVGYKDHENVDIGWFPAKLDDYLNYIPARITGFLLVVSSYITNLDYEHAWKIMVHEARNTPSPNSGYSMAAAAGALNVQLIKPGVYRLGISNTPLTTQKISEAIKLSTISIILFLAIIFIILIILIPWS